MGSNDKLKEIDIKNRTCYYFNDILMDEKSYENILVYEHFVQKFNCLYVLDSIK